MDWTKKCTLIALAISLAGCAGHSASISIYPSITSHILRIHVLPPKFENSNTVVLSSTLLPDGHLIQVVDGNEQGVLIDGRYKALPQDKLGGQLFGCYLASSDRLFGMFYPYFGSPQNCFAWDFRTGSITNLGRFYPHVVSPNGSKVGLVGVLNASPGYYQCVYNPKSGVFTQLADSLNDTRSISSFGCVADSGSGVVNVLDNHQNRAVRFDTHGNLDTLELQPQDALITINGATPSGGLVGSVYLNRVDVPAYWAPGQTQPTYLAPPKAGSFCYATCINDSGAIGGYYYPKGPNGKTRAVIWPEGYRNPNNVVDIDAVFGGKMGLPKGEFLSGISGFYPQNMMFYGWTVDSAGNQVAVHEFEVL